MTAEPQQNASNERVVILKLSSSEEVIGRIRNETPEIFSISNPVYVRIPYDAHGNSGIVYFENACSLTSERFIDFRKRHVVCVIPASPEVEKMYQQYVGDTSSPSGTSGKNGHQEATKEEFKNGAYTPEQIEAYFEKTAANTTTH
jgi:hypothetical protein